MDARLEPIGSRHARLGRAGDVDACTIQWSACRVQYLRHGRNVTRSCSVFTVSRPLPLLPVAAPGGGPVTDRPVGLAVVRHAPGRACGPACAGCSPASDAVRLWRRLLSARSNPDAAAVAFVFVCADAPFAVDVPPLQLRLFPSGVAIRILSAARSLQGCYDPDHWSSPAPSWRSCL